MKSTSDVWRSIDPVKGDGPVGRRRIGRGCVRTDGENIEVSGGRGDFIAYDRREELPCAQFGGCLLVVDVDAVVGGNRQLDALPGQGNDPLAERSVAVA